MMSVHPTIKLRPAEASHGRWQCVAPVPRSNLLRVPRNGCQARRAKHRQSRLQPYGVQHEVHPPLLAIPHQQIVPDASAYQRIALGHIRKIATR